MQGEQLQLEIREFRTELGMQILVKQSLLIVITAWNRAHIARQCTHPKRPHNSEYFKDKMLLIQAQENGVVLDEEQLLFIAGGQDSTFDDDVDEPPTMFMANLSSADPIYDEVGPSYDLDILFEVQDHDNYLDNVGEYHEVHEMQNDVQQNYVVDSDAEYTSDSNIILYEQYVKNNAKQVIQSIASSVPNDALMMITNDMHEQAAQCISVNEQNKVVNESLTAELARYKEKSRFMKKGKLLVPIPALLCSIGLITTHGHKESDYIVGERKMEFTFFNFELGTTRDTLRTTPEGGVLLGPERHHTYDNLNDNDKKRFDVDVLATNIVLQGLPKEIYKLINHNIEAKAIWDNVKMIHAGSELTKEDKESQLYDEFERFTMLPGENINEYYVWFHKLINDMRNIRMKMPNIQLNSKFVNNMSPEWDGL
ncbi:hypothetical protein Tco_0371856 [Tanacetum coccineum]